MKSGFLLQAVGLAMSFAVGGFFLATLCAFYIWSILFGFVDCQPDLIWFDDLQTNLIRFVDANPILFGLLTPTQSYSGLTTAKPVLFLFAGRQTTICMIKFQVICNKSP